MGEPPRRRTPRRAGLVGLVGALALASAVSAARGWTGHDRHDQREAHVLELHIRSVAFRGTDPIPITDLGSRVPARRGFNLRSVRRSTGSLPLGRGRALPGDLVAIARDGSGHERARRALADPHVLRAEWPDAGGRLHGVTLYRPAAEVLLAFPDDPAIRSVDLYRLGDRGDLRPLGTLELPR